LEKILKIGQPWFELLTWKCATYRGFQKCRVNPHITAHESMSKHLNSSQFNQWTIDQMVTNVHNVIYDRMNNNNTFVFTYFHIFTQCFYSCVWSCVIYDICFIYLCTWIQIACFMMWWTMAPKIALQCLLPT